MTISRNLTNTINIIDTVSRNGLCTGCGICQSIAPKNTVEMKLSHEGFLRPKVMQEIDSNFHSIFKDICPGLKIEHDETKADYHPIWGPILEVRTGHATEPEIRHRGSSGGVISAIAIFLLEQGLVDFVAQIAVSHDDPISNILQISRTRADVLHAAGSRYAPSAPLSNIRELLDMGERFAFIGKPCDIAALRRYAHHEPRVNQLIPYMLSFMCAGIPSLHGTFELLEKLDVDRTQLKSFRYRGDGWPGMTKAITRTDQVAEMDYNSSWGNILGKYLQFRCKICPDGTGEFADIVCADAWYSKDGYPDFTERKGRSLIISRTQQGKALIQSIIESGFIQVETVAIDDITLMQPYQITRKKLVLGRLIATRLALGMSPRYQKLGLIKASLMINPITWLRNVWGTYRRAKLENQ